MTAVDEFMDGLVWAMKPKRGAGKRLVRGLTVLTCRDAEGMGCFTAWVRGGRGRVGIARTGRLSSTYGPALLIGGRELTEWEWWSAVRAQAVSYRALDGRRLNVEVSADPATWVAELNRVLAESLRVALVARTRAALERAAGADD